ncbi:MAG: 4Fe-4S dicluster domain-containing protein [Methanosarcina sp.]|uniref:4Fe-4S dicluster domain-containing protein n=1 Tax=Methanosarcina sp. TaxID=2213 RepID=UPI0026391B6F|nr:4Fe-4S dicluster domain-containing protein [Methanosarcina sp.]MDD3245542.1 4Fe-4S dicluster domain-containing protein [Methanosarcina sp.]
MNERIRLIIADEKKCIGCRACTSVCPEGIIHFSEEGGMRNIQFPGSCTLNCELCALNCPENAIMFLLREESNIEENIEGKLGGKLEGEKKAGENRVLLPDRIISLKLMPCRKCGATFATLKEIEKVRKAISEKVPLPSGGDFWMELCPGCRRGTFREKEAKTLLMTRKF